MIGGLKLHEKVKFRSQKLCAKDPFTNSRWKSHEFHKATQEILSQRGSAELDPRTTEQI